MKINIENYNIECFENVVDYKNFLQDHALEKYIVDNTIYHGKFYDIPQNIRSIFKADLLLSIRMKCYNDTQYILMYK